MTEILRIKAVLKDKGITQKELAARMEIHPVTLSQNLSRNPTLAYLQKIADTLGVHILDLFDDDRPIEKPPFECPHCHKQIIVKIE